MAIQRIPHLVATITLLIPTTLMGATLPLVVKRFGEAGKVGRYSGFFYAINTLGALTGVLLAGFVLMPILGVSRTTWTACAINLLIGVGAILLGVGTREDPSPAVSHQPSAISRTGPRSRIAQSRIDCHRLVRHGGTGAGSCLDADPGPGVLRHRICLRHHAVVLPVWHLLWK